MKYALITILVALTNCTPADIAPTAERTVQTENPDAPTTSTQWGIGSPVAPAWLDGENQQLGTFNIFSHLPVSTFCTMKSMGEYATWFQASTGKHYIYKSMTNAQYLVALQLMRDALTMQNMIEDVDYEIQYNPATLPGQGFKIIILNPNFSYGGQCNDHYLI